MLKNIVFQSEDFQLSQESNFELLRLVSFLKKNTEISIVIRGYIFDSSEHNLQSAESCVKAMYDFLVKNNIDSNRLVYPVTLADNKESSYTRNANNCKIEFSVTSITKNIYFQINTDFIEENTRKFLNHLISSIPPNVNIQFEIIPISLWNENQWTPASQGNASDFCSVLKQKRVKAIYNYLLDSGVQKNNIKILTNNISMVSTNSEKDLKVILYVL